MNAIEILLKQKLFLFFYFILNTWKTFQKEKGFYNVKSAVWLCNKNLKDSFLVRKKLVSRANFKNILSFLCILKK